MYIRQHLAGIVSAASLALVAGPAAAIHVDIEAELVADQFVVDNAAESGAPPAQSASLVVPGRKIFESEFGGLSDFATDDPGFDIEDGSGLAEGTLVGLSVVSGLRKWVGGAWVDDGFDEFITIIDNRFPTANMVTAGAMSITDSGAGNSAIIDAADDEGGLHTHVDFFIDTDAAGDPMDGAYMLELIMFGELDGLPAHTDSDPFVILFHLDAGGTFDEDAFEMAVDALAPVPVPAAVYLLGGGLAMLGGFRRSRKAA